MEGASTVGHVARKRARFVVLLVPSVRNIVSIVIVLVPYGVVALPEMFGACVCLIIGRQYSGGVEEVTP